MGIFSKISFAIFSKNSTKSANSFLLRIDSKFISLRKLSCSRMKGWELVLRAMPSKISHCLWRVGKRSEGEICFFFSMMPRMDDLTAEMKSKKYN